MFLGFSANKGLFHLIPLMRKTTISLDPRHSEWMEEHPEVSLAGFVRKRIDEEIEKSGELVRRFEIPGWLADKRDVPEEFEGVMLKEKGGGIKVAPVSRSFESESVWLPKSQVESGEPVGVYEEEVDYPEK